MFNLFDIMQHEGGGTYGLARQFGLSPDQSRTAIEALLPALTIGLQRNAVSDPAALGRMFGLVGAHGQHGGGARSPQHTDILGPLFGSPALAQAVLEQAASASGIGAQALRPMLPVMAGMVVAGIVHVMLNQAPPAPPPGRRPDPPPTTAFPQAELWNDWMKAFLPSVSAEATAEPVPRAPPPQRTLPRSLPQPDRRHAVGSPSPPPKSDADATTELFQQMFQSGIQAQEQNVKAMQDLFDSFWSAPNRTGEDATGTSATPRTGRTKPVDAR